MKTIFIILLIFLAGCSIANEPEKTSNITTEMKFCETKADCTLVDTGCQSLAVISKESLYLYNNFHSGPCSKSARWQVEDHVLSCVDNVCEQEIDMSCDKIGERLQRYSCEERFSAIAGGLCYDLARLNCPQPDKDSYYSSFSIKPFRTMDFWDLDFEEDYDVDIVFTRGQDCGKERGYVAVLWNVLTPTFNSKPDVSCLEKYGEVLPDHVSILVSSKSQMTGPHSKYDGKFKLNNHKNETINVGFEILNDPSCERLEVNYDYVGENGTVLTYYLYYTFYISEDGSLYHGKKDHSCSRDPDMSPEEALQPQHLAFPAPE